MRSKGIEKLPSLSDLLGFTLTNPVAPLFYVAWSLTVDKPALATFYDLLEGSVEQSMEGSAERSVEGSMEQSVEGSVEQSLEGSVEQSVEGSVE